MAFDTVFFLRENAPGLLELALSVGIVASLSALGSFAVSAFSRRVFDGAALLALGLLLAPEPATAFVTHRHEDVRIAAGERVDESLVTWGGDRVDIDGTVDGDVIAASERVTIRGEVTGSLYVFCRDLEITGKVGGAVHAIAESTRVEGEIGGQLYVVGEDITLSHTSQAKGDVTLFAEDMVIEGPVGRDVHVAGDRLDVSGEVGRHVHALWLDEIALRDSAHVHGDVEVRLEEGREVDRAAGARVDGEVRAEQRMETREHYLSHYRSWRFYAGHLLWFAAAFLFGLLGYAIAPAIFRGEVRTGPELLRALGTGLVTLVMVPVVAVVAALTIVGIPIAVVFAFLYVVALYTADLVVGAWLGRLVTPPANTTLLAFGKSFGVGLLIVNVVALVPFIGPAIGLVCLLFGLGLLTARGREALG
jgi:cytoskeletal protein CcmA (bactofilin family)